MEDVFESRAEKIEGSHCSWKNFPSGFSPGDVLSIASGVIPKTMVQIRSKTYSLKATRVGILGLKLEVGAS